MLEKFLALRALAGKGGGSGGGGTDDSITLTQDEYESLVASGSVEENKYYVIVGDSE